ncbi:hypothetical protein [Zooshikella sp. RANM57]|uniref:hypothetical protein n=1 Tax=Zooshikella sp. RANM57 TaxID=3425863 RepID=UPI003D6F8B7F
MSYEPLLQISLKGEYFADNSVPDPTFKLTKDSQKFIQNAGLICKPMSSGINVLYDTVRFANYVKSNTIINTQKNNYLEWKVDLKTDLVYRVIDWCYPANNKVFYFVSDYFTETVKHANDYRLYPEAKHLIEIDNVCVREVLTSREKIQKPLCIIKIKLTNDVLNNIVRKNQIRGVQNYTIIFKTASVYWSYLLNETVFKGNYVIKDKFNELAFNDLGKTRLANGKTATCLRSNRLIPLYERSRYWFQLLDSNQQVLIKRLPVASPHQIVQSTIENSNQKIANIYVNY